MNIHHAFAGSLWRFLIPIAIGMETVIISNLKLVEDMKDQQKV